MEKSHIAIAAHKTIRRYYIIIIISFLMKAWGTSDSSHGYVKDHYVVNLNKGKCVVDVEHVSRVIETCERDTSNFYAEEGIAEEKGRVANDDGEIGANNNNNNKNQWMSGDERTTRSSHTTLKRKQ